MESLENKRQERLKVIITLVVFTLIYASVSLLNHYMFRTSAFDLGIKNHAIYNFSQFKLHETSIVQPSHNYFSNHFVLITALVSPFYYLFGTYTLLIVQIASILIGGLGVYQYFRIFYPDKAYTPIFAMIHFFSLWGILSALAFDYHENVVGAAILPWFFFFFKKEKLVATAFVALLVLFCKENMALWMFFIAFGLFAYNYKNPARRWFCLGLGVFSVLYFVIVVKLAIPYLGDGEFKHFRYTSTLGSGFGEAFITIFTEPFSTIKYLFVSHLEKSRFQGIKGELHLMVMVSGGIALLIRPKWLIMLIPIYAQKLLHDDAMKWGMNYHYSIEFAPILSLALFEVLSDINKIKLRRYFILGSVLLTVVFHAIKLEDRRSVWYAEKKIQFYHKKHYQRSFDVWKVHRVIDEKIPDKAPLSAHTRLVPHLIAREKIYMFPKIKDAEYIALLRANRTYPMKDKQAYKEKIEDLKASKNWHLIHDANKLNIFKKAD